MANKNEMPGSQTPRNRELLDQRDARDSPLTFGFHSKLVFSSKIIRYSRVSVFHASGRYARVISRSNTRFGDPPKLMIPADVCHSAK